MFRYELHQHTWPCSHCAKGDPAKTVYALKEAGFAGLVLTNHFFHGNTGIDRNLPWADFVRCYEEDYLAAKKAGDEIDFDVIFGIEEHIGGHKEVLLYGITPEFLYAHPEISDGKLETVSNAAREFGALVFQAHPYRSRDYIDEPLKNLDISYLDGMETFNAANPEEENLLAEKYAEEHGLLQCAGSDAHREVQAVRFGINSPVRIRDSFELVKVLRSGEYTLYLGE